MDAILALVMLSLIIILGVFGEIFFRKTGIPDVLWLILFGFLVTSIFGIINPGFFNSILPVFMAITLIVILFEGGLHMRLGGVLRNSLSAIGLAFFNFIYSTILVAIVSYVLFLVGLFPTWSIWTGIILGSILGGISSIIVMPLTKLAKLNDNTSNMLQVESAFSDAICVVVTLTLLIYISVSGQTLGIVLQGVVASLAIGLIIGLVIGFVWLYLLEKLQRIEGLQSYFYFLTFALMIFLYVFVEYLKGSSVVAIFVFGLVMGNSLLLRLRLKLKNIYLLDKEIILINGQLAFLIKSFFFVLIGVMFLFEWKSFVIAAIITLTLIVSRYFVILTIPSTRELLKHERMLLYFFSPKGLAAGVLAIAAMGYSNVIPSGEMYPNIVFGVIILSILISTIALFVYKIKARKYLENEIKQSNSKKVPVVL
jgi:potassium/hydrogen antiporter